MSSPSCSSSCSMPCRHRRRRLMRSPSSLSSSAVAAAATILAFAVPSSSAVQSKSQQQDLLDSLPSRRRQPDWYEEKTRVTMAKWRSLLDTSSSSSPQPHHQKFDRSKLRPLDLVIDYNHDDDDDSPEGNAGGAADGARHSPPRAYQKGNDGFLEPYDFINYQFGNDKHHGGPLSMGVIHFSEFSNSHGVPDSSSISTDIHLEKNEDGDGNDVTHHKSSGRIGLTNFDLHRGIGDGRGKGMVHVQEEGRKLSLLQGKSNNSSLRGQAQSLDTVLHILNEDESTMKSVSDETRDGRQLSSHHKKAHDRLYDSSATTSYADKFADISESTASSSSSTSSSSSVYFNSQKEEDVTPPVIRSTFPPADTAVGSHQTFGALISDGAGGSGIESACVQFKDHVNFRTACLDLSNVGENSDIWEQTFDGFEEFDGKTWKYRLQAFDKMKNRRVTRWQAFTIDATPSRPVETTTTTTTTTATTTSASATTASATVGGTVTELTKEVRDENWPYKGIVQNAVGRILFFFDSNFYVCSGTLLKDNTSDRSIVLTAAHCAYQASSEGGRFTEHAIFVPDQSDTTAGESNEICSDDPLGCWLPAFAVVHYEWTTKAFPDSVPWDYAYYVIPNDPGVHLQGFLHKDKPDMSKILEELVEPLPVNFNWMYSSRNVNSSSRPNGDFTHAFGYSVNRDPSFRYCATEMGTKFGIATYENLWLSSCEMSGGSSGGPWLIDTTSDGRGTIISLNSWGYASVAGMGGPNLATASGSKAECVFEVAKSIPLEEGHEGVVVNSCG